MSDCQKIAYRERRAALAALLAVQRWSELRDRKVPTGVYLCTPCRSWHLTSKSKSQTPPWDKKGNRQLTGPKE